MELPRTPDPAVLKIEHARRENTMRSNISREFTDTSKASSATIDSAMDEDFDLKAEELRAEASSDGPSTWAWRSGYFLRIVVFTVYRQLLTIVCIVNTTSIVAVVVRSSDSTKSPLGDMATAAMANLTAAVLTRQITSGTFSSTSVGAFHILHRCGSVGDLQKSTRMAVFIVVESCTLSAGISPLSRP